jgi:hypothetical protein
MLSMIYNLLILGDALHPLRLYVLNVSMPFTEEPKLLTRRTLCIEFFSS